MKAEKRFVYTEEVTGEIVNIPIKLLHHHHLNPRKEIGDVSELADSIKKRGILQNLTVVPFWYEISGVGSDYPERQAELGYLVVIGNRRLEAAKLAGLDSLPCVIAKMTHAEQVQTMLLENMQRNDLTVYEQAQSFQQLHLEFGFSENDIAENTGFSKSTVHRRLKMAELDQEILKEVSARQISLGDFDRLQEIKDEKTRNKVLSSIGTNNFDFELQSAIREAKKAEKQKKVRDHLKSLGITEIKEKDRTTKQMLGWVSSVEDNSLKNNIKKYTAEKLYFHIDRWSEGHFYLYIDAEEKQAQIKKVQETKKQEKIVEFEERLEELDRTIKAKQKNFVYSIKISKSNETAVYCGALAASLCSLTVGLDGFSEKSALKNFPYMVKNGEYNEPEFLPVKEILEKITSAEHKSDIPKLIWRMFVENSSSYLYGGDYYSNGYGRFPHYASNEESDALYLWLITLGYEMSDEEKAYRDGTHSIFQEIAEAEGEK